MLIQCVDCGVTQSSVAGRLSPGGFQCNNCRGISWIEVPDDVDLPETTVNVRWWDGYLEVFEASEVRFGCDLLWMHLANGSNRHIPLRQVRWFSTDPESHQQQCPTKK